MEKLSVGFARVDITPKEPVPLGGFGNTMRRFFRTTRDPLTASCFAITDEQGTTAILITCDATVMEKTVADGVRDGIEARYGVPRSHIIVTATHTHAGPDMHSKCDEMMRYYECMTARLICAAGLALADRRPAELYMGDIETEGMNFVRHYQYTDTDGTVRYFGDNFGTQTLNETTKHITPVDPTLHVLKFVRQGCKDLILTNFRGHPVMVGGSKKYDMSGDCLAQFCREAEKRGDMTVAYFQGAAGNVNCTSRIIEEQKCRECTVYGQQLAAYLFRALTNMRPVETAPILVTNRIFEAPVNHSTDHLLKEATWLRQTWNETGDNAWVKREGAPYGIRSPYHAGVIITRTKLPATLSEELSAVTIGNLAFVAAPNELFDTLSVYVEEHAPYTKVLTLGYANGHYGYIPSKFGYEYTCYESDTTRYAPGAGEELAQTLCTMLEELKARQG